MAGSMLEQEASGAGGSATPRTDSFMNRSREAVTKARQAVSTASVEVVSKATAAAAAAQAGITAASGAVPGGVALGAQDDGAMSREATTLCLVCRQVLPSLVGGSQTTWSCDCGRLCAACCRWLPAALLAVQYCRILQPHARPDGNHLPEESAHAAPLSATCFLLDTSAPLPPAITQVNHSGGVVRHRWSRPSRGRSTSATSRRSSPPSSVSEESDGAKVGTGVSEGQDGEGHEQSGRREQKKDMNGARLFFDLRALPVISTDPPSRRRNDVACSEIESALSSGQATASACWCCTWRRELFRPSMR